MLTPAYFSRHIYPTKNIVENVHIFIWSGDSKYSQNFCIFPTILMMFSNSIIFMDSISLRIFIWFSILRRDFKTVPSTLVIMGTTVTHTSYFQDLSNKIVLFYIFSFLFHFTLRYVFTQPLCHDDCCCFSIFEFCIYIFSSCNYHYKITIEDFSNLTEDP